MFAIENKMYLCMEVTIFFTELYQHFVWYNPCAIYNVYFSLSYSFLWLETIHWIQFIENINHVKTHVVSNSPHADKQTRGVVIWVCGRDKQFAYKMPMNQTLYRSISFTYVTHPYPTSKQALSSEFGWDWILFRRQIIV